MKLKLYLAGPISGLSYSEACEWRIKVKEALQDDYEVIDPMRGKFYLSEEQAIKECYPNTITSGSRSVYRRDRCDIKRCDIILVNLSDGSKSIGTLVEMGMADAWEKLIIVIGNPTHPFLTENSIQVPSVEEAIEFLRIYVR